MIAMGVAALVFIIALINPFQDKKEKIPEEDLLEVVMATDKIEQSVKITAEMVEMKKIHKNAVPEEPITSIDEVVDKIALTPMFKGDIFTNEKAAEAGSKVAGLASDVPLGMRAITMNVEQATGVSGMIRPSNTVDVISVIVEQEVSKSVLLLQDRKVLAVDRNTSFDAAKQDQENYYVTVTLLVTPEESVKFSLAQVVAQSNHVVLRNQEDIEILNIKDMTVIDLMN